MIIHAINIMLFCLFGIASIPFKLHLLNKKAGVSSDMLVGHVTSSQNESAWPIKIYDGARVTLFNKALVSCDVNQQFLILLFE